MILSILNSQINGEMLVPSSKSHTIRAIAIATLASGESILKSPLVSDDTVSCLHVANALGAWVDRIDDFNWKIAGTSGHLLQPAKELDLGNSGTGLRIFTALSSLAPHSTSFYGDESLSQRPMASLLKSLQNLGVATKSRKGGHCPLTVYGPLFGGETDVDGTSSQYLSALLLATPLAPHDTILNVPFLNERPYVDMTLDWLKRQKIRMEYDSSYTRFKIYGKQKYLPFNIRIPGDFSSAAFPLAAAIVTGGSIKLKNLDFNDSQGDKIFIDFVSRMGIKFEKGCDYIAVNSQNSCLHGAELDLNSCPDLLPVLCVIAACAEGVTVLKNVPQARLKETDRIAVMAEELTKMNITIKEFEDGIAITGGTLCPAHVNSHGDHRIAMSLAIAGMVASTHNKSDNTVLESAEAINVTYPSFIRDFQNAGAKFSLN